MSAEELAAAQKKADERMRAHWKVEDGALVFDGNGDSLCTAKDYGDFEMYVTWKILPKGDSGIYLRGSPQLQIWDTENEAGFKNGTDKGSGALWNNQKHERFPLVKADKPVGQWNTFYIKMVGERVTVKLNGQLVTDNVVWRTTGNATNRSTRPARSNFRATAIRCGSRTSICENSSSRHVPRDEASSRGCDDTRCLRCPATAFARYSSIITLACVAFAYLAAARGAIRGHGFGGLASLALAAGAMMACAFSVLVAAAAVCVLVRPQFSRPVQGPCGSRLGPGSPRDRTAERDGVRPIRARRTGDRPLLGSSCRDSRSPLSSVACSPSSSSHAAASSRRGRGSRSGRSQQPGYDRCADFECYCSFRLKLTYFACSAFSAFVFASNAS